MEPRVKKLEEFAEKTGERLTRIEAKLDHTVTKADLTEAINSQIKWMVGTAAVISAAAITVMTFVLNNAVPKAPAVAPGAVAAPAPVPNIIINVPPTAAAPAPTGK